MAASTNVDDDRTDVDSNTLDGSIFNKFCLHADACRGEFPPVSGTLGDDLRRAFGAGGQEADECSSAPSINDIMAQTRGRKIACLASNGHEPVLNVCSVDVQAGEKIGDDSTDANSSSIGNIDHVQLRTPVGTNAAAT